MIPPSKPSVHSWYKRFIDNGCVCVCKGKITGRPSVRAEHVEITGESFVLSPRKSVRRQ
jgi:hypothetical protein